MKVHLSWGKKDKAGVLSFVVEECLSKAEADKLRQHGPERIVNLPKEERLKVLGTLVGAKADFVNARIETDMILPAQKTGLLNWISAQHDVEPKWRQEIVREIGELKVALDEKEMDAFAAKLANLKLGVGVTQHETQMIYELSDAVKEAQRSGNVTEYEKAKKALDAYVASLMPKRE
jgi:hypothetical protein